MNRRNEALNDARTATERIRERLLERVLIAADIEDPATLRAMTELNAVIVRNLTAISDALARVKATDAAHHNASH